MQGDIPLEALVRGYERRNRARRRPLDDDARRRLRELVFGTVRLKGRYDHLVRRAARRRPDPPVRVALWLALHEILELSTPDHAAVSQAVALARGLKAASAAGFVNGVLRRILREGPARAFGTPESDPVGWAATWLSHPRWLVERWARRMPADDLLALCEADNRRPPLVLRCAPGTREQVLAAAAEREWRAEAGRLGPDAVVLRSRVPAPRVLKELPGATVAQDEAAQLVAPLLTRRVRGRLLDLCAAPGGKAGHLIQGGAELVVAADRSPTRLRRLADLPARVGPGHLLPVAADGRSAPFADSSFDGVLVDAPCTGTGVLARRHDARWRRRPTDLDTLPRLQSRLLDCAVDLCAPGGIIVYATCSLEPEENDEVVDAVLARRDDLVEIGAGDGIDATLVDGLRLRVLPHRHGCDGAFAAVLQRRETKP
jgi:16S rRNA (cytosine967-C5)-methyltransferase